MAELWEARIAEVLSKSGHHLYIGYELIDHERAHGDRIPMRSALMAAHEVLVPDARRSAPTSSYHFSLCRMQKNKIVAGLSVSCEPENGFFWVPGIFVSASHRNAGLGRAMVEAAIDLFSDFVQQHPNAAWEPIGADAISDGGAALCAFMRDASFAFLEKRCAAHEFFEQSPGW